MEERYNKLIGDLMHAWREYAPNVPPVYRSDIQDKFGELIQDYLTSMDTPAFRALQDWFMDNAENEAKP